MTAEALNVVQPLNKRGSQSLDMTGRTGSILAGESDVHLDIFVLRGVHPLNLAPHPAYRHARVGTLAIALSVEMKFTREDFHRFHPGGNLGKELKSEGGGG